MSDDYNVEAMDDLRCAIIKLATEENIGPQEIIDACASVVGGVMAASLCSCCRPGALKDFMEAVEEEIDDACEQLESEKHDA
jgi:hypothetical protein